MCILAEVTKKNLHALSSRSALWVFLLIGPVKSHHRPDYYKWTQWIFLQLFKHGLAIKRDVRQLCTSCKCVLANEKSCEGVLKRCGSPVVHKIKSQWMLKITAYADRLINDLDLVEYPSA